LRRSRARRYKGPEWDSWYGFVAPAKTPKEIVDKIALGVKATLARPDIREKLLGVGLQPVGGTPDEFRAFLAEKNTSYARIIKEAGIRAE
jgi:tripartite-type tricarboxylate transporter receptor subunit TctC